MFHLPLYTQTQTHYLSYRILSRNKVPNDILLQASTGAEYAIYHEGH